MLCSLTQGGITLLFWATIEGRLEVASLLVDRGANKEATDKVNALVGFCNSLYDGNFLSFVKF